MQPLIARGMAPRFDKASKWYDNVGWGEPELSGHGT
jgi:hypothetical protein